MKTALITGITGQDGALLARLLLSRGYRVVGAVRRAKTPDLWRLEELGILHDEGLTLAPFDLLDPDAARRVVGQEQPDEVYNLGGQSSVTGSFAEPVLTMQSVGAAPLQLLEAIRQLDPKIRFFQASSAEMFGSPRTVPQDEDTALCPRTPYGAAKVYAHWITTSYRESFGLFACSAILYNHESAWRAREFVTRKITDSVAKIRLGKLDCLRLGRLETQRDWGYAPEYVDAMHRMLQAPQAENYVLATGHTTSIRDFAAMAFQAADMRIEYIGTGLGETAIDLKSGRTVLGIDPALCRPVEARQLVGDPTRARAVLDWMAQTPLVRICAEMVEADLRRNSQGMSLP